MSIFQAAVDEQLVIDGIPYFVCAHPTSPTAAYIQRGQEGQLVQVRTQGGYVALKVVRAPLAGPAMIRHAAQLASLAAIDGLQAANRLVIDPQANPALMTARPELAYAVLMPWVYGPSWRDVLRTRRAVTAVQAQSAARALAVLLGELERRGLAHGDLQSGNLMLPGLDVDSTSAVALVDLERVHGNRVDELSIPPRPSEGYCHRALGDVLGPLRDRFAGAVLISELLAWSEPEVRTAASGESFFEERDLHQDAPRVQVLRAALQRRGGAAAVALFDRAWQSTVLNQCPRFAEWRAVLEALPAASDQPYGAPADAAATMAYAPVSAPPAGSTPFADSAATMAYTPGPSAGADPYAVGLSVPEAEATQRFTPPAAVPPAAEATAAVSFETLVAFAQSLSAQGRPAEAAAALRQALSTLPPGDLRAAPWQAELARLQASLPAVSAPPAASPRRAGWVVPVVAVLLLLALLGIGTIAFILLRPGGSTAGSATPTPAAASPAVLPTRAPTEVPTPTQATLVVSELAPAEIYTGDGRIAFVVRGSGFADVKEAVLVGDDGLRLPLTIGAGSSDSELRLSLDNLPAGFSGLAKLGLELNGVSQPSAVLVLRDFLEERSVVGILPDYTYTGRVVVDALGASASIHESADVNSPQTGLLRAGDSLQVLSAAAEGWYLVRIVSAPSEPARSGQVGFIERWLVDNTAVPTPAPTNTPAASRRLRFVKLNENDNPNCISVGISGIRTTGWTFTIDGTNNVGRFDTGGNARVCGLATQQEVTFTVRDGNGRPVPGGVGVPSRGSAIMGATWQ